MHLQKMFCPTKWWYAKLFFDNKVLQERKITWKWKKISKWKVVIKIPLTQNWQNIPRSFLQNDNNKTAKASPSIKTMPQKGPGKTKASHLPKAEIEANKKENAKKLKYC